MKPSNIFHAITRRGESGQSIIVLGIAFLALLGFVGIVTDVSLLFVRYSGLRRAVDAAAVSAAGQMRTDRNFATVNFAARTFIEFYGISPTAVEVQTCLTAPGDPELCTPEQRKLVRVRAQILSPTVFMRLLGFRDIVLEASSTSETAVMDVVLVIDVSESMGDSTSLGLPGFTGPAGEDYDYADIGMGYVYRPPIITYNLTNPDNISNRWYYLTTRNQGGAGGASDIANITNNAIVPAAVDNGIPVTALGGQQIVRGTLAGATLEPRAECRVRFYPSYNRRVEAGDLPTWDGLLNYYSSAAMGGAWQYNPGGIPYWSGYVPTYNFYGCCNSPGNGTVDLTGNITNPTSNTDMFNFSDLICQPFKQARDAVRSFLQRVDFTRGDRVAMVTFNRSAFLIDPNGSQAGATHMMDTFPMALQALNTMVGLNAEPNFYDWNEISGGWQGFAAGSYDDDNDIDTPNQSIPINYDAAINPTTNPGVYDNFPVLGNCYMMNALQGYPNSRYSSLANQGAILDTFRLPEPALYPTVSLTRVYTQRGACRDANIGAALREANNALNFDATRRVSGAVWVIILVSDGAAGASDPVLRSGSRAVIPNPYNPAALGGPIRGEYGAFGVCPYVDSLDSANLPFCSDDSPETRQFCAFNPTREVAGRPEPVDIFQSECLATADLGIPRYDVDDYARDWADWVGLLESGASQFQPIRPTIFTIGFGITFPDGGRTCSENVDDCLGEELLRYIADVGDNFRLDIDYQQDYYYGHARDFDPGPDGFGPRGLCEAAGTSGQVARLGAGVSCGNYYNAPDASDLDAVFDDIASKMFTRIAN